MHTCIQSPGHVLGSSQGTEHLKAEGGEAEEICLPSRPLAPGQVGDPHDLRAQQEIPDPMETR